MRQNDSIYNKQTMKKEKKLVITIIKTDSMTTIEREGDRKLETELNLAFLEDLLFKLRIKEL